MEILNKHCSRVDHFITELNCNLKGTLIQYKDPLFMYGIPILETTRPSYLNNGNPMMIREYPYTESQ